MKKALTLYLFILTSPCLKAQKTVFEESGGTKTATYSEGIEYYRNLSEKYPTIKMESFGETDSGFPLHLITWSKNKEKKLNQIKILVNNAIHPGEPDGVEASMLLMRDLASGTLTDDKFEHVTVGIIPFYNVGGVLNRNSYSRVNQNGPEAYGFRGNSRNYDLNRDFIKMDSKNAEAFSQLFHAFEPDVFIDTHVSNGANYQYPLTIIETQRNKIGKGLGNFIHDEFTPAIVAGISEQNVISTPFVNVYGKPPDEGYSQFMDYPRYSSGYASLYNVISYMTETHMLKPFQQRVLATYEFLKQSIIYSSEHANEIKEARKAQHKSFEEADSLPTSWSLSDDTFETLSFKGYEAEYRTSPVTKTTQLYYNEDKPFEKDIPYYSTYEATSFRRIPEFYIIPQSWFRSVKPQFDANHVSYDILDSDTSMEVSVYRIASYETFSSPYEGHYPHYNTTVDEKQKMRFFEKGTVIIPTKQKALKYIFYCLEPETADSFFNWNFFDTILQQKEHFSPTYSIR